jgi:hypothetical protein
MKYLFSPKYHLTDHPCAQFLAIPFVIVFLAAVFLRLVVPIILLTKLETIVISFQLVPGQEEVIPVVIMPSHSLWAAW